MTFLVTTLLLQLKNGTYFFLILKMRSFCFEEVYYDLKCVRTAYFTMRLLSI